MGNPARRTWRSVNNHFQPCQLVLFIFPSSYGSDVIRSGAAYPYLDAPEIQINLILDQSQSGGEEKAEERMLGSG